MTHDFELRMPGLHGATSVTGRCADCPWSITLFMEQSTAAAIETIEQRLRERHAEHVPDAIALDELMATLPSRAVVTMPKLDAHEIHPPGYNARPAAPPQPREAWPVIQLKPDGAALEHPFGYKRGRIRLLPPPDAEASNETPLEDVQR